MQHSGNTPTRMYAQPQPLPQAGQGIRASPYQAPQQPQYANIQLFASGGNPGLAGPMTTSQPIYGEPLTRMSPTVQKVEPATVLTTSEGALKDIVTPDKKVSTTAGKTSSIKAKVMTSPTKDMSMEAKSKPHEVEELKKSLASKEESEAQLKTDNQLLQKMLEDTRTHLGSAQEKLDQQKKKHDDELAQLKKDLERVKKEEGQLREKLAQESKATTTAADESKATKTHIDDLKKQLKSSEDRAKEHATLLAVKDSEIEKLKKSEGKAKELEDKLKSKDSEIDGLRKGKDGEAKKLREEHEAATKAVKALEAEKAAAAAQHSSQLTAEVNQLKKAHDAKLKEIEKAADQKVDQFKEKLRESVQAHDLLKTELADLKTRSAAKEKTIAELEKKANTAGGEKSAREGEAQKELEALAKEKSSLGAALKAAEDKLKVAEGELTARKREVEDLNKTLNKERDGHKSLERKLTDSQKSAASAQAKDGELKAVEGKLKELQTALDSKDKEISDLKAKNAGKVKEEYDLKQSNADLKVKLAEATKNADKLEAKLKHAEDDLAKAKTHHAKETPTATPAAGADHSKELHAKNEEIAKLTEKLNQAVKDLAAAKKAGDDAKKGDDRLKSALNEVEDLKKKLAESDRSKHKVVETLTEELKREHARVLAKTVEEKEGALQDAHNAHQTTVARLSEERDTANKQAKALEKQLQQLQKAADKSKADAKAQPPAAAAQPKKEEPPKEAAPAPQQQKEQESHQSKGEKKGEKHQEKHEKQSNKEEKKEKRGPSPQKEQQDEASKRSHSGSKKEEIPAHKPAAAPTVAPTAPEKVAEETGGKKKGDKKGKNDKKAASKAVDDVPVVVKSAKTEGSSEVEHWLDLGTQLGISAFGVILFSVSDVSTAGNVLGLIGILLLVGFYAIQNKFIDLGIANHQILLKHGLYALATGILAIITNLKVRDALVYSAAVHAGLLKEIANLITANVKLEPELADYATKGVFAVGYSIFVSIFGFAKGIQSLIGGILAGIVPAQKSLFIDDNLKDLLLIVLTNLILSTGK